MSHRTLVKIGEGRESEIYAWDTGMVLRLMRDPAAGERLAREAAALRSAGESGAPVPTVRGLVQIDGRPGLVMERIDGFDLIAAVAKRPWTIARAARKLGEIHERVHQVEAPLALIGGRALLAERIAVAPLPVRTAAFAQRVLEELPDGSRLCHGDFHPGNVLVGDQGSFVIDWTNASRGDPDSDVACTLLMLELAVVPESWPLLVRRMASVGRRFFHAGYLRAYRRLRSFDPAFVERWKIVHAAARCSGGIAEETPLLIAYVEQRINL
jgi:aminoglycoside phosphotransferase (APT) family kinase protein